MKIKTKSKPATLPSSIGSSCQPNGGEIARRAYLLWEQDGCTSGRDLEYWLQAEALFQQTRKQDAVPA